MSETEFITFGCRLNTYESEVMRTHAAKAGVANTIVFNTCAVTAEATRQARQAIRKARKEKPDADRDRQSQRMRDAADDQFAQAGDGDQQEQAA